MEAQILQLQPATSVLSAAAELELQLQVSGPLTFSAPCTHHQHLWHLHWADHTICPRDALHVDFHFGCLMCRWWNTPCVVCPWELEWHLLWNTVSPVFEWACTCTRGGQRGWAGSFTHHRIRAKVDRVHVSYLHHWFWFFFVFKSLPYLRLHWLDETKCFTIVRFKNCSWEI